MKSAISWFEIPVTDYNRAKKFYTTVLGIGITDHPMPDGTMEYGVFDYKPEEEGVGGAIFKGDDAKPSMEGVTVYLNGGNDLSLPLSRVERAGGKVLLPKTDIGENGFFALLKDTEGNKVALHSMS
ncbi:VOC family protein [Aureibaculum sp. A20]|uniref:VOC family protein n=1 Tax=Aureibaculum flavum TaxID=2795986 RepID=A0ABS0WQQ6_9FLAO|nr:VOC family protein [Aureibaculum flavum]MBJ2174310.1 VOC family protein [Aureibaculum flavum]